MPLLKEDLQRISMLGFKESYFSIESKGSVVLRNSDKGRCVFHDGKQCTIYQNRPAGCKLYPVVFDEELSHPVKDKLCPFSNEFPLPLKTKQELSEVYLTLIDEGRDRKSTGDKESVK
jgi:Fe-S-cluster containining protein